MVNPRQKIQRHVVRRRRVQSLGSYRILKVRQTQDKETQERMGQRVTDLHWGGTTAGVLLLLHAATKPHFFPPWTQLDAERVDGRRQQEAGDIKRAILWERHDKASCVTHMHLCAFEDCHTWWRNDTWRHNCIYTLNLGEFCFVHFWGFSLRTRPHARFLLMETGIHVSSPSLAAKVSKGQLKNLRVCLVGKLKKRGKTKNWIQFYWEVFWLKKGK